MVRERSASAYRAAVVLLFRCSYIASTSDLQSETAEWCTKPLIARS